MTAALQLRPDTTPALLYIICRFFVDVTAGSSMLCMSNNRLPPFHHPGQSASVSSSKQLYPSQTVLASRFSSKTKNVPQQLRTLLSHLACSPMWQNPRAHSCRGLVIPTRGASNFSFSLSLKITNLAYSANVTCIFFLVHTVAGDLALVSATSCPPHQLNYITYLDALSRETRLVRVDDQIFP